MKQKKIKKLALLDLPLSTTVKNEIDHIMGVEEIGVWDAIESLVLELQDTRKKMNDVNTRLFQVGNELQKTKNALRALL